MAEIIFDNSKDSKTDNKYIAPKYSKATAFRLWKEGILTEAYYTSNYMDSAERSEYYRYKREQEINEQLNKAKRKEQEKKDLKELEDQVYKTVEKVMSSFFGKPR